VTTKELLKIHGMGPKAIRILGEELATRTCPSPNRQKRPEQPNLSNSPPVRRVGVVSGYEC
jgi:hypothetical protein